ncbi:hypothetical protein SNOG_12842 [Parastagonospora nodorum SN15]|uniref:Uncharacterized protein n=1 Tax=Phaeosphaeria nodorum (strain SN15 / ATCC MYA-4574 / FGSC 10173) TaxID=321614 RepID=Q0U5X2_PHANO|nr:hypothetical protein SNOG_12842 [Parastagonospora nodorum SN15]EAT79642.1 hypothetical protein SNOG_12842 [Parastagonospora nodorum SN15]
MCLESSVQDYLGPKVSVVGTSRDTVDHTSGVQLLKNARIRMVFSQAFLRMDERGNAKPFLVLSEIAAVRMADPNGRQARIFP